MCPSPLGVFGTNHFAGSKSFGDSNPFAHSPFLFHFFTLSTNHCRCSLLSSSSTNRRLVTQSTASPNHLLVAFPSTYRRPRSSSTLPSRSLPGTSVVVFVHKQPFTSSCPSFKNFCTTNRINSFLGNPSPTFPVPILPEFSLLASRDELDCVLHRRHVLRARPRYDRPRAHSRSGH